MVQAAFLWLEGEAPTYSSPWGESLNEQSHHTPVSLTAPVTPTPSPTTVL